MRIVAGQMRGRRLVAPDGLDTRPTSDRVRESIFAILAHVDGLDVIDLFADELAGLRARRLSCALVARGSTQRFLLGHDDLLRPLSKAEGSKARAARRNVGTRAGPARNAISSARRDGTF